MQIPDESSIIGKFSLDIFLEVCLGTNRSASTMKIKETMRWQAVTRITGRLIEAANSHLLTA